MQITDFQKAEFRKRLISELKPLADRMREHDSQLKKTRSQILAIYKSIGLPSSEHGLLNEAVRRYFRYNMYHVKKPRHLPIDLIATRKDEKIAIEIEVSADRQALCEGIGQLLYAQKLCFDSFSKLFLVIPRCTIMDYFISARLGVKILRPTQLFGTDFEKWLLEDQLTHKGFKGDFYV